MHGIYTNFLLIAKQIIFKLGLFCIAAKQLLRKPILEHGQIKSEAVSLRY